MSQEYKLYLKALKKEEPVYSDKVFEDLLYIMDNVQKETDKLTEMQEQLV